MSDFVNEKDYKVTNFQYGILKELSESNHNIKEILLTRELEQNSFKSLHELISSGKLMMTTGQYIKGSSLAGYNDVGLTESVEKKYDWYLSVRKTLESLQDLCRDYRFVTSPYGESCIQDYESDERNIEHMDFNEKNTRRTYIFSVISFFGGVLLTVVLQLIN